MQYVIQLHLSSIIRHKPVGVCVHTGSRQDNRFKVGKEKNETEKDDLHLSRSCIIQRRKLAW